MLGQPPAATDPRTRLLEGLAAAITEKGYAAATIADIVRHARVSKRTFYEHFTDKEAAYLALYSLASDQLLALIADAATGEAPWDARLRAAAEAYLRELAARPALTRTYLMDVQAAGPRALALRREVHRRFAALLRRLSEDAAAGDPAVHPLSAPLATALVGGINELLLEAIEEDRTDRLAELAGAATDLIRAVVTAGPPGG